ncbi:MAG: DUF2752 domain-containing protein [Sphingobacteriaceae bacterium]|nr:MAG: DUF2752 domain-containing protein [Sphingobacteriaceae bacterium]
MIHWLQHYLLPCPFKYLTGIDCPGCGFQRSVIELMQGNIKQSFILYPPAMPILLVLIYYASTKVFKLQQKSIRLKPLLIIVACIIMLSYTIKMLGYARVI